MDDQEKQEGEVESQVYEANDFPQEELASEGGDDEDAEPEVVKTQEFEAARQWRVGQALLGLRTQINQKAPNRNKASDGTIGDAAHASRNSDHNPWVVERGTGVVTAMDITNDPANGCDANQLAETLRGNKDARVKYIIWNRRIVRSFVKNGTAAWTWLPYTGSNPHNKHVHISVKPEKASYDSTAPWQI